MFGITFGKFSFFRRHLIRKVLWKLKMFTEKIPLLLPIMMDFVYSLPVSSTKIEKSNQVTQKPKIKLSSGGRRLYEIEYNVFRTEM